MLPSSVMSLSKTDSFIIDTGYSMHLLNECPMTLDLAKRLDESRLRIGLPRTFRIHGMDGIQLSEDEFL